MFNELLIPESDFSIEKSDFCFPVWAQKKDFFWVEANYNKKKRSWKWRVGDTFWLHFFSSADLNEFMETKNKIASKQMEKFSSKIKATQALTNNIQSILPKKDFDKLDFTLHRRPTSYHNILTSHYPFSQDYSGLYFVGKYKHWHLYYDGEMNTDTKEVSKLFDDVYQSRSQAIKAIYDFLSLNLHQVFLASNTYSQAKDMLYSGKNNFMPNEKLKIESSLWWVIFTRPEVDLNNVFG